MKATRPTTANLLTAHSTTVTGEPPLEHAIIVVAQRTLVICAAVVATLASTLARADTFKCERAIAKASAKYTQAAIKALGKCEVSRIAGELQTTCLGYSAVQTARSKAAAKRTLTIEKACGGADKTCGGADDESALSLGWPPSCPNYYYPGTCTNPVGPGCNGVDECLGCIDDGATAQMNLLMLLLQVEEPPVDLALNACQQAIAKSVHAYAGKRSKFLQKCWDGRLKAGGPANPCPDAGAPAGSPQQKAAAALATLEAKMHESVCKACGGGDQTCDGSADLDPAAISLAGIDLCTQAPAASLDAFVSGLRCFADAQLSCMDAAAVPDLTPYPVECVGDVACSVVDDCPGVDTDCQVRECKGGVCSVVLAADGAPCDDGDACTQTDVCWTGVCAGGSPVVCSQLDECHDPGTCDSFTGLCSNPSKADGMPCDDGDACTQTDVCWTGICAGGSPVVCSQLDECHDPGTCDSFTGLCSNPPAASGTPMSSQTTGDCQTNVCDGAGGTTTIADDSDLPVDGNECTDDQCLGGAPSNPATTFGTPCNQNGGTQCDGSGMCVALLANGDACSSGGQCQSGQCVDGVCCNTSCSATCQACTAVKKGSGSDGTCGSIATGTDPDNECPLGDCNGSGACVP